MIPCYRSIIVAAFALSLGACGERAQAPVSVPASPAPEAAAVAKAPTDLAKKAPVMAPAPGATVKPPVAKPTKPQPAKAKPAKAKLPEVPFEGRRIALVHTANVIGELEPCG